MKRTNYKYTETNERSKANKIYKVCLTLIMNKNIKK